MPWRDGLAILRTLTRRADGPNRKLLGSLVDAAGSDHAALLAVIKDAEIHQPDHPIAWIRAAVDARTERPPGNPRASSEGRSGRAMPSLLAEPEDPDAAPDPFGINAWIARQPDVEVKPDDKGIPGPCINGWMLVGTAEEIAEIAGLEPSWRGNWDAMGAWIRDGIEIDDGVLRAIGVQAGRMGHLIRSIAVFDGTVRNVGSILAQKLARYA